MEIIQKNIILESSKSRIPGLIPSIEMGFYAYNPILLKWEKDNKATSYNEYVFSNDDFPSSDDENWGIKSGQTYFSYGLSGKNGCNGNWGKCVYDIDVDSDEMINSDFVNLQKIKLPFVTRLPFKDYKNGHRILRYKNMMSVYYWLMNFYKKIVYYKLCIRKNSKTWVKIDNIKYNDENILLFLTSLPNGDENSIGDIIGINEECEVYNSYFINDKFSDRLDLIFYDFVNKTIGKLDIPIEIEGIFVPEFLYYSEINEWYNWLNSNKNITDCCLKEKYNEMGGDKMLQFLSDKIHLLKDTIDFLKNIISSPYINIPILLSNDIDEMGEFSLYSQQWISGNKYYVGDTTIYVSEDDRNGSSYVLAYGDEYELIEMPDSFYNIISGKTDTYLVERNTKEEIDKACKNEVKDGKGSFIKNGKKIIYYASDKNKCYLPLAYYYGYYDENNKEIYFDTIINNSISFQHWKINSDVTSIQKLNIDGYNQKWSADEGILNLQVDSKLLSLRKYKKSYDDDGNELPGILVYNIVGTKKEPNKHLDFIFETGQAYNIVEVIDDISKEKTYYGDIIKNIEYSINGDDYDDKRTDDANFIRFTYYIGSKLICRLCDSNKNDEAWWEIDEKSGVKYEEVYDIKINEILYDVTVDGTKYDLTYDEIDFNSKYTTIYDADLDFAPRKVILSNVTTTSNQMFGENDLNKTNNIINSLLYKEEYKMGVTTPLKTDINVYVDRGINAAFERHLILGEINTYQDMENYRNNYFNFEQSL